MRRYETIDAREISRRALVPCVALALLGLCASASGKATITTFDPTGSVLTIVTTPKGINDVGSITGWYEDSHGIDHGFVRTADGTITAIDFPGSADTYAVTIN